MDMQKFLIASKYFLYFFSQQAEVLKLSKSSRNSLKYGFTKGGGGSLNLPGKWLIVAYFCGQIGLFPPKKPGNTASEFVDFQADFSAPTKSPPLHPPHAGSRARPATGKPRRHPPNPRRPTRRDTAPEPQPRSGLEPRQIVSV